MAAVFTSTCPAPPAVGSSESAITAAKRGFVSYTVASSLEAVSGATISAQARVFFDESPPVTTNSVSQKLDVKAPTTLLTVSSIGNTATGQPQFNVLAHRRTVVDHQHQRLSKKGRGQRMHR